MGISNGVKQPFIPHHLDDIIVFGKHTILVCLLSELALLSQLSNTMYMVYAGATPVIKGCGNVTFTSMNDACDNLNLCEGIPLDLDSQFYSINEEWDLYCNKRYLERRSTSFQMLGVMIGSLTFGEIGSSFGRKKPLLFCLLMSGLLSLVAGFVNDLVQFSIIRFMLGVFTGGHSTIVVVYMLENVPIKSRMWINTAISYSPNVIVLGIMAYFFQHWRSLTLVVAALHIPAVALMLYLNESPRWLVQKGKIREARQVILDIARMDGKKTKINETTLDLLLQREHDRFEIMGKARNTYRHVFQKRGLAFPLFVISFSFFCGVMINYGNMFNLNALSGSIYLNSILIGSLRYSTNLFCGFLDYKFTCFGRKTAHTACQMLILGLLILSTSMIVSGNQTSYGELTRYCVLIICALASQVVIVDSVTCNEFFPTSVRTRCYSFVQLWCRLGIVLAPYLYSWNELWPYLSYTFLIVVTIMNTILYEVVLSETKNKPLEDHIVKRSRNTTEV
ncbi:hypothetical protein Angca_009110 [Angiostrongylus cantonensis]|nr:hypothetical protein Angca_009110 [Angiostrongylus cantonensis]